MNLERKMEEEIKHSKILLRGSNGTVIIENNGTKVIIKGTLDNKELRGLVSTVRRIREKCLGVVKNE